MRVKLRTERSRLDHRLLGVDQIAKRHVFPIINHEPDSLLTLNASLDSSLPPQRFEIPCDLFFQLGRIGELLLDRGDEFWKAVLERFVVECDAHFLLFFWSRIA